MKKSDAMVVKRIFVKVFGFSDVERHALNSIFRLSEDRPLAYAPWTSAAPYAAEVVLIDGQSWEAALELANPGNDALTLIWVGDNAPARASLAIARPLKWSAVIERVDQLLAFPIVRITPGGGAEHDIDLDRLSEAFAVPGADQDTERQAVTAPLPLKPLAADSTHPQVLLIDADPEARFYLRAKLATAGLAQVDEAASSAEALLRLQNCVYKMVLLDLDLPDSAGWQLVKQIRSAGPAIEVLILTGSRLSRLDAMRGWFAGARGSLRKPFDPVKLNALLRSVT
jgi:CheY-like chemotaxis protein